MSSHFPQLWEALGRPPWHSLVPPRRCLTWQMATRNLRESLRQLGINNTPHSWQQLWRLVHHTDAPRTTTWGDLCQQFTIQALANASTTEGPMASTFWNVRWLCDPHSALGTRKRGVLRRLTASGALLGLAETHWDSAHIALWRTLFPGAEVRASPARVGPRGGPQGGVALVIPNGITIEGDSVTPPECGGCAICTIIRLANGTRQRMIVLYLPPGKQVALLHALTAWARGLEVFDGTTFVSGDLNIDPHKSETEQERTLLTSLHDFEEAMHIRSITINGPTRIAGTQEVTLDYLGVSPQSTLAWDASLQ